MRKHVLIFFVVLFFGGGAQAASSLDVWLSVRPLSGDFRELIDGAGRKFVLVPRGKAAPAGYPENRVIETPVQRLASTSRVDVGLLAGLGVLEKTLVGVSGTLDSWKRSDVRKGLETGRIVSLGKIPIDYELLKFIEPDVLLVSNLNYEAMASELGITCVVTYSPMAIGLESQINKIAFLAPLFNREEMASAFIEKTHSLIEEIRNRASNVTHRPAVLWGDIYEQYPVVEPPSIWMAEFLELVGGKYMMEQGYAGYHQMISLEKFYYLGRRTDIMFSYRLPEEGLLSKAAMKKIQPLLADIRPLNEGRLVLNRKILHESLEKLDEILLEMAAILHPEIFGRPEYRYFIELQ